MSPFPPVSPRFPVSVRFRFCLDDLSGTLVASAGVTGSVEVQGDLSGGFHATGDPALAGSLSVGGSVTTAADIYAAGPVSGTVTVGSTLAGVFRTATDPNAAYDADRGLSGRERGHSA